MTNFTIILLMASVVCLLTADFIVAGPPSASNVWASSGTDSSKRFTAQAPASWYSCSAPSSGYVSVTPSSTLQAIQGFGGALTEASAYNFMQLKNANSAQYQALLKQLFSPAPSGIGISMIRFPITSNDMSVGPSEWTCDDTAGDSGLNSVNLNHLSGLQLPILSDIMNINPNIKVIADPWTAPIWMKDSNAWGTGSLLAGYYQTYGTYLAKVLTLIKSSYSNINFWALTLQNEPENAPNSYPGMTLTYQNEMGLSGYVAQALSAAGLSSVKIIAYDHNWNDPQYPINLMGTSEAQQYVNYVAFHCYSGSVSAQTTFHNAFPNVPILFTECSGTGSEAGTAFNTNFMWNAQNLFFGNINNWGQSTLFWNLNTNVNYGPNQGGGCTNCRGVITLDASNSASIVQQYNSEYYILAHFSALIPSGSQVFSSSSAVAYIEAAGFSTTVTGQRVIQLLNTGTASQNVVLYDASAGACSSTTVTGNSVYSYQYGVASSSATPIKTNLNTNYCIDVVNQNYNNGALLQLYACGTTGQANQQWQLINGAWQVYSGAFCIDVPSGNTNAGTQLQIYQCVSGNTNQQWVWNGASIQWSGHDLCLGVGGGAATNGAAIVTVACTATAGDQWTH